MIDFCFRSPDGKYYILDWKTNYLGDTLADYSPTNVKRIMFEKDYVLQYHIYALALHRLLTFRLKDYNPSRHFGGIVYFFTRAMLFLEKDYFIFPNKGRQSSSQKNNSKDFSEDKLTYGIYYHPINMQELQRFEQCFVS